MEAARGLLSAGINPNVPNQKGVTPISAAAHKGSTTIIQLLVDAGASVNAINSTGSTALIQASHFGHLNAVKLLLKYGSIADFANSKGTTALMRASQEGYVDIVVTLLDAKSEVNRKNNEGMNSLMLASQRGHEKVVLVLVKYGAAMDEQTSQGSTALMLACKRGHESVVEVLVSCGAEIYMRDCRARSARDTAVRRQHGALLAYLDTQVQVKCLQDTVRAERADLLKAMREASNLNRLEYSRETGRIFRLMQEINRYELLPDGSDQLVGPIEFHRIVQNVLGSAAPPTPDAYCTSYGNMVTSSPSYSSSSTTIGSHQYRSKWIFPADVCMTHINSPLSSSFIASAPYRARHPLPAPPEMSPHRPGYAPWQWPYLLKRVFDLPLGVHELVIDFLPAPRIWKTCIHRLKRRVTLAPQAATLDISIMLDEMITDMCLFSTPRKQGQLVTLSRHESIINYLSEQWHMPTCLTKELVTWSDVQSLIARSADCDITFKANLARKFLLLAASMYRYLSSISNPRVLFCLSTTRTMGYSGNNYDSINCKTPAPTSSYGASFGCTVNNIGSGSLGYRGGKVVKFDQEGHDPQEVYDNGHGGLINSRRNGCDLMDIDFAVDIDEDDDSDRSGRAAKMSQTSSQNVSQQSADQEHYNGGSQNPPFQQNAYLEEYENDDYAVNSDDDDI